MRFAEFSNGNSSKTSVLAMGILLSLWLVPPVIYQALHLCPMRPDGVQQSFAYSAFARRYGVECEVCHTSLPQLSRAGYMFRAAGYRMPDEIGSDAKWSNWGDNMSVRTQETYNVSSAKGASPETNGFSNGGLETYPLEGAFGKYWAANDEADFSAGNTATTKGTAGSVSMNTVNM